MDRSQASWLGFTNPFTFGPRTMGARSWMIGRYAASFIKLSCVRPGHEAAGVNLDTAGRIALERHIRLSRAVWPLFPRLAHEVRRLSSGVPDVQQVPRCRFC